jgi:UDP-N-acetylmuramate dehydrogenase
VKVLQDVSLKKYNTFGLDYKADCLVILENEQDAISIFNGETNLKKPYFIIGGGSNILFTQDFRGTILKSAINGINIEETGKEYVIVSAGSGVIWDSLVEWTVEKGFGGLENLSLIPGLVGATPVQNIGAYGVEVKDSIIKVRAVLTENGEIKEFTGEECCFGYRTSTFKENHKGKYLITRVYYKLSINPLLKTDYGSLKDEISKLGEGTLKNVREAVINIRRSKLPDPDVIGNAGSFFKNPVVKTAIAENLKRAFPEIPLYNDKPGYTKIAAGWLIDKCGWKGFRDGDAAVHDKQALVLVNHGTTSGKEIYNLSIQIKKSVQEKFGIILEPEVEVTGSI